MTELRWKQRFENFDKAYSKFKMVLDAIEREPDNEIYQMALVQAFEFVYELGWKTMKDFLLASGVQEAVLPRDVLKLAFRYKVILDGQVWIDMMLDRNILSHTYNDERAKKIINRIRNEYCISISELHSFFTNKLAGE